MSVGIWAVCACLLCACQQRGAPCRDDVASGRIQAEFQRVSRAIRGSADIRAEACLGVLAFRSGDFKVAVIHDRRALALAHSDGDRAHIDQLLASALKYTGRPGEAMGLLDEAIRIHKALGDTVDLATDRATLASIYSDIGDYAQSIRVSLASVHDIRKRTSIAATYNNVAMDYLQLQQYTRAFKYIDKAIRIDTASGHAHSLGIHEINKGIIFNRAAMYAKAAVWLKRGIEQSRGSGDAFWMMVGEGAQGVAQFHLGHKPEALNAFRHAAAIAHALGQNPREAAYRKVIAQLQSADGPSRQRGRSIESQ